MYSKIEVMSRSLGHLLHFLTQSAWCASFALGANSIAGEKFIAEGRGLLDWARKTNKQENPEAF
ncbi:hypothetical protein QUB60_10990 [Microcoleus sp. A2-C5]|uniref:hypothetical protein n=1 Tax=unclassified Microcoleus TaxID=2642155 RepID=UPI002FD4360D